MFLRAKLQQPPADDRTYRVQMDLTPRKRKIGWLMADYKMFHITDGVS